MNLLDFSPHFLFRDGRDCGKAVNTVFKAFDMTLPENLTQPTDFHSKSSKHHFSATIHLL